HKQLLHRPSLAIQKWHRYTDTLLRYQATRALSPTHPFGLPFRGNSANLRGPVPRVKSVRCDPRRDPHSEDLPCLVGAGIPVRITVRPEVPISGARGRTLRAPHTPVKPERPFSTWPRPHRGFRTSVEVSPWLRSSSRRGSRSASGAVVRRLALPRRSQPPQDGPLLRSLGMEQIARIPGTRVAWRRLEPAEHLEAGAFDHPLQLLPAAQLQVLREVGEDQPRFASRAQVGGEPVEEAAQHAGCVVVDAQLQG